MLNLLTTINLILLLKTNHQHYFIYNFIFAKNDSSVQKVCIFNI